MNLNPFKVFNMAAQPAPAMSSGREYHPPGRQEPSGTATEAQARAMGERITITPPKPKPGSMHPDHQVVSILSTLISGTLTSHPAEMRKEVLKAAGVSELLTRDERKLILDLRPPWENTENALVKIALSDPSIEWSKYQQQTAADVREGRSDEIHSGSAKTIDDFKYARSAGMHLLKDELHKITAQTLPTQFAVAERIGAVAGVLAAHYEREGREMSEAWGQEYHAPRLVIMLQYLAAHPREMVPISDSPPWKSLTFAGIQF